jgi:DNA-binding transcriptional ArsR family regulator
MPRPWCVPGFWRCRRGHLDKWVSSSLPLVMAYGNALAVLADPTRRQVFERLRNGPRPVNVLAAGLPVSRPAVSQHLKVLKHAGLVEERSEGVRRIYSLRREGLLELRAWLDSFWDDALEAFKLEAERSANPRKTR